jgi:heterodisulfide reductase subunit C
MTTVSATLERLVKADSGVNANKCYQCRRCSAGCPVAGYSDMHPAQIMRAVQLGQLDMILDDRFIWLCTGCQTCTTRCPQEIDVAGVMDELKIIARREGRVHPDAPSAAMLQYNYDSFVRWGRMWEVELIARDALKRPSGVREWLALGPKMLLKGKINPTLKRGDTMAMKRMVKTADSITKARATQAGATASAGPSRDTSGPDDGGAA